MLQTLCQGLFRNERLPITVSKELHGIYLLCCQILPWLRDALENLDLNASNIQRILFPTNEETKKFNGYGEHLPPMERGERGAGSSHSLVLTFPFPHYFTYCRRCNWFASAWLLCELQKNTMLRALWTLLDHRIIALEGSLEIISFRLFIFLIRKLCPREVNWIVQYHTVSENEGWDKNMGILVPGSHRRVTRVWWTNLPVGRRCEIC